MGFMNPGLTSGWHYKRRIFHFHTQKIERCFSGCTIIIQYIYFQAILLPTSKHQTNTNGVYHFSIIFGVNIVIHMDRKDGFPWFFGVIPWFSHGFPVGHSWAIHHQTDSWKMRPPLQDATPSFPAFPPPPGKMQRGKKGVLAYLMGFFGIFNGVL